MNRVTEPQEAVGKRHLTISQQPLTVFVCRRSFDVDVHLYGINLRICGAFASSMMVDWRRFRFLLRDFFVRM